jgi:integrase
MQLTRLTRHASHVIPVTSNTPNHHTGTTIQAADAYSDHDRSIATRISLNTGSARTRHSYVSHLIEDGVDPLFVQQQVGHSWASTTAIYTTVGADARNRMLRSALSRAYDNDGGGEDGGR